MSKVRCPACKGQKKISIGGGVKYVDCKHCSGVGMIDAVAIEAKEDELLARPSAFQEALEEATIDSVEIPEIVKSVIAEVKKTSPKFVKKRRK